MPFGVPYRIGDGGIWVGMILSWIFWILVVALVVGSLLAVFLAYQALFNSGTLLVSVAQLRSDADGAAQKR